MRETQRLDKWLWYARFFKSRTLAAKLCAGRRVRVNRVPVDRASTPVGPGDVLTFPQGRQIRVIRVLELGARRGPAVEARQLYEDLDVPAAPPDRDQHGQREAGAGRPTKRDRRELDRWRQQDDAS